MPEARLPVRLIIQFPTSAGESCPVLLGLARRASNFSVMGEGGEACYQATFADVTESLDQVIELVGEALKCPEARVTVNGRTVSSLIRFSSTLLCYRESLAETNPRDHCLRYSARLNQFSGCPDQTCLRPCQFLCTRCVGLVKDARGASLEAQLREFAIQAEVDWCPNLGVSDLIDAPEPCRFS